LVVDENLDLAVLHHTNTTAIEVSQLPNPMYHCEAQG
jgi:hypothetical protein